MSQPHSGSQANAAAYMALIQLTGAPCVNVHQQPSIPRTVSPELNQSHIAAWLDFLNEVGHSPLARTILFARSIAKIFNLISTQSVPP